MLLYSSLLPYPLLGDYTEAIILATQALVKLI